MISACDIRYCAKDTKFTIKEVDVGLAADVGTLQRFPKVVGNDSWTRELAYTARNFDSTEALEKGFVSKVLDTREQCIEEAIKLATFIASKSPVAVTASKQSLNYSRDHSVQEGLDHIATINAVMLQTDDLAKSA
jgi:delta(3,5)-delta(2,4)-dienoyl-CoA isomerase